MFHLIAIHAYGVHCPTDKKEENYNKGPYLLEHREFLLNPQEESAKIRQLIQQQAEAKLTEVKNAAKKEQAESIAIKMLLKRHLTIDQISDFTDLTPEEIEEIHKKVKKE